MPNGTDRWEYVKSLAPHDPDWRDRGVLTPLDWQWRPDPRDYLIERIPRVQSLLAAGLPDTVDLRSNVVKILDQGQEGSCVAFTDAAMESLYKKIEHGVSLVFDGHKYYAECGGVGNSGLDARQAMQQAQTKGIPVLGDSRYYRVGSYAVAYGGPTWADTIRAALASNHPVQLALLLPSQFGWTSGGSMTSGYHSVLLVGYGTDPQMGPYWLLQNSWTAGWGNGGYGRVPVAFCEQNGNQQNYCFALTTVDYLSDGLGPAPPPPAAHLLSAYARDASGNVTTTGVLSQ